MSKKPEILFVLNGHKYVSYFFEPLAHYSISKGLSVGVALPKTGELDHEKWSEASKVLRFLAVKKIRNPWDIIAEFFQSPFIPKTTNILHIVTTHMIFLTLVRLNLNIEKFSGVLVFHFIGLGRVFGGKGLSSFVMRNIFRLLWLTRKRRNIAYRCVYLNDDDYRVLLSVFGNSQITYIKVPGAGVRTERFDYEFTPPKEPIKLLFVGRLIKEKGLETFLELISQINDKSDIKVEALVVGGFEKSEFETYITKYVSVNNINQNVKFIGEVSNPSEYFKKANYFIFPTMYGEGVPTVLLEAQYCGTPCLASNIAGCKEAIIDGVTGVIVKDNAISSWLDTFVNLNKTCDYQLMCTEAHAHVRDNFNANFLAKLTVDWMIIQFENWKETSRCYN